MLVRFVVLVVFEELVLSALVGLEILPSVQVGTGFSNASYITSIGNSSLSFLRDIFNVLSLTDLNVSYIRIFF